MGTISLLAGIDLLTGEAVPLVSDTHKSSDFVSFLKILDAKYPEGDTIRLILDNHSAHTSKTDRRRKKALELYRYLSNNREGLVLWQKRGIEIPAAPEGIVYKGMGVQESQNCTVITLRMKHRRMRWSVDGANNMAKILYRRTGNWAKR